MAEFDDPQRNRLLAALMGADQRRWRSRVECVELRQGEVLNEPGRPLLHAYFPTSAVVSLLRGGASGSTTEVAVVGDEGVIGTSLILGADSTTLGSAVLVSGQGFRIGADTIRDEFGRSDAVRSTLLHYVQALATQIAQNVVCYRHHSIEQQLCGWLLHIQDRLQGSEIVATQELIADLLSVRRESVTTACGQLQGAGLIHCSRGHLFILDPLELERRSCECHAVVKKEYDRLLPRTTPTSGAVRSGASWRLPPAWPPMGHPAQLHGA